MYVLGLLGESIDIELELEAEEKSVGSFRADILAKATQTDTWVLIEHQFEHTDHGHLGQIITYAAGLKAMIVIWVAEQFTDEHVAALDWLNSITDDNVHFYGVQVEAWSIGTAVAPRFNVVSRPNSWTKKGKTYKRSVTAYNSDFDRKRFVYDCLAVDPDLSIPDIQRKARQAGQSISVGSVSMYRKVFLSSKQTDNEPVAEAL